MNMPYQVAATCDHDMMYVKALVGRIPSNLVHRDVAQLLNPLRGPVGDNKRHVWHLTSLAKAIDGIAVHSLGTKAAFVPADVAQDLAVDMVRELKSRLTREVTTNLRWLVTQMDMKKKSVDQLAGYLLHIDDELRVYEAGPKDTPDMLDQARAYLRAAGPDLDGELYENVKQTIADVNLVMCFMA